MERFVYGYRRGVLYSLFCFLFFVFLFLCIYIVYYYIMLDWKMFERITSLNKSFIFCSRFKTSKTFGQNCRWVVSMATVYHLLSFSGYIVSNGVVVVVVVVITYLLLSTPFASLPNPSGTYPAQIITPTYTDRYRSAGKTSLSIDTMSVFNAIQDWWMDGWVYFQNRAPTQKLTPHSTRSCVRPSGNSFTLPRRIASSIQDWCGCVFPKPNGTPYPPLHSTR